MKSINKLSLIVLTGVLLAACKGNENKEISNTDASLKETPRNFLYFDATANFRRFTYRDSIDYYLKKSKEVGVTDVVIDLKPISGEVLYPSKIAPVMTEWKGKHPSETGTKDMSWDMMTAFIEEGHKLGLKVHASTNMFSGGHIYFDRGLVYEEADKKDWQTINYLPEGMTPITQQKGKFSAMLNPALREVQEYELSIIKELVTMYPEMDGLVLDRVRYDGIYADFSDASRKLFEGYLGSAVENFPEDIYSYSGDATPQRIKGPLYKKWLEWRAKIIHDFMTEARDVMKSANPNIEYGDYTGSWYPTYYEVGVNWASNTYDPSKDFDWATPEYKNYGYADVLDVFLTGNYYYEVERKETANIDTTSVIRNEAGQGIGREYWYTVEGSADLVNIIVGDETNVYAGIYVEQYKDDKQQFIKAIKMCRKKSKGAMIFDIVHVINKGWWDELKKGLNE